MTRLTEPQGKLDVDTPRDGAPVCPHHQSLLVQGLQVSPKSRDGDLEVAGSCGNVDAAVTANAGEDRRQPVGLQHVPPRLEVHALEDFLARAWSFCLPCPRVLHQRAKTSNLDERFCRRA